MKRKSFSTTMDIDVLKKLKVYCAQNGLKQNEAVESIIREFFKKNDEIESEGEGDGDTD